MRSGIAAARRFHHVIPIDEYYVIWYCMCTTIWRRRVVSDWRGDLHVIVLMMIKKLFLFFFPFHYVGIGHLLLLDCRVIMALV